MMNFADRLLNEIDKKQNPCIVGLDPRIDKIPSFIKEEMIQKYGDTVKAVTESFLTFNRGIIDSIFDLVPAVKPQMAFYEKYGQDGIGCFLETVKHAKAKGLIVIEDAKRNDIGPTATAYSSGHIGEVELCSGNNISIFNVDAITINPYLGSDGILPFLKDSKKYGKGCFVLVKTSNPSSTEIQNKTLLNNMKIYELVASYVNKWGSELIGNRGYQSIGAVVGATYAKQSKTLRKIMNRSIFLAPGYGAQGATSRDVIPLFNKDGYGAIINSSRKIIFAYSESKKYHDTEYDQAARNATEIMKKEITKELTKAGLTPL